MNKTPEAGTGIDVLVIDDDAIMRDLVADWLEAAGYTVRKAGDCGAGVAELERAAPALVVTDMWMPGTCGAAAIAWLKGKRAGLKVIAVSGNFSCGQRLSAEGAIDAGAARALGKPVKRSELLRAVAELIGPPPRRG